jgi:hypothetical protein
MTTPPVPANVTKLVRFAYAKYRKPPRLATSLAVSKAQAAAQRILDAGYSVLQVCEMIALITGPRPVLAPGEWDGDITWWRNIIVDLPSLAEHLLVKEKFAPQYEVKAHELHEWLKISGHTTKDWLADQLLEEPKFPQLQRDAAQRAQAEAKAAADKAKSKPSAWSEGRPANLYDGKNTRHKPSVI